MSDKISQAEAERLLNMLKHSLTDAITFPLKGETETFEVIGDNKRDTFVVHIFRGNKNSLKYNFGAQIKNKSILLLELHINPSNVHTNPDGEKVKGNHWHIYSEQYGRRFAFQAENIESDKFVENTLAFLDRFHVLDNPEISYQEEL